MPIGVTGPSNQPTRFGPGLPLNLTPGITPNAGDTWRVGVWTGAAQTSTLIHLEPFTTFPPLYLWTQTETGVSNPAASPIQGTAFTVFVEHQRAADVIESGQASLTYEATAGLGQQTLLTKTSVAPTGSFTATDRANLQTTQTQATQAATNSHQMNLDWQQYQTVTLPSLQNVLNTIITDITAVVGTGASAVQKTVGQMLSWLPSQNLTEIELHPASCAPFIVDVSRRLIVAVHVEITAYPQDWVFQTPDAAWSVRDLATIRFYRGTTLLDRNGVHTIIHSVMPLPGITQPPVFSLGSVPWLPDGYQIAVDFAEGVCGRLVAQLVP